MLSEIEAHAIAGMVLQGMTKSEIHKVFPQDKWKDVDAQIKKSPKAKKDEKPSSISMLHYSSTPLLHLFFDVRRPSLLIHNGMASR